MSSDNQNPSRASTLRRPSNCSLPQITACVKLFFTNSPLTNTLTLHISYKNNQQTPNQHSHRDTNLISMSLEYIQNIILNILKAHADKVGISVAMLVRGLLIVLVRDMERKRVGKGGVGEK